MFGVLFFAYTHRLRSAPAQTGVGGKNFLKKFFLRVGWGDCYARRRRQRVKKLYDYCGSGQNMLELKRQIQERMLQAPTLCNYPMAVRKLSLERRTSGVVFQLIVGD